MGPRVGLASRIYGYPVASGLHIIGTLMINSNLIGSRPRRLTRAFAQDSEDILTASGNARKHQPRVDDILPRSSTVRIKVPQASKPAEEAFRPILARCPSLAEPETVPTICEQVKFDRTTRGSITFD